MSTISEYMGLNIPTVGADANTWGGYIAADLALIDALAVYSVVPVSTSGNLAVYNGPALIKATGGFGGISLALPNASGVNAGRVYIVVKVDSGAGAITITTSMSQTISGVSTASVTNQWSGIIIQSDGANWVIIGTPSAGGLITPSLTVGTTNTVAGAIVLEGYTSGSCSISAPAVAGTITNPILVSNSLTVRGGNLTVGVATASSGVITLTGSTSGSCSITAPATAGTITNPIALSNSLNIPSTCTYQVNGSQIAAANLSDTVGDTGWSSTPTSLSNVGGAPAITGQYARVGPVVYFTIVITPVTNTSSVAGTTSFSLPIACTQAGVCYAVDAAGLSLGNGNINSTAIYPPTWTTDASVVTVAGWYFAA